jgi:predicted permease
VFQSGDLDRHLDAEIESHIRLRTEDYVSRGVLPDEAERRARIELGGIAQLREAHRETRSLPFVDTLVQDLRYAFRGMRRDAAFTAFAILITGIGIGASSTVFSVVNTLLLRPLPFRDPGSLIWIANQEWSTQVEQFQDLRDQNRSFTDLAGWFAGYGAGDWQLTGTGEPERLTGVPVTRNFFSLLGVEPVLGRSFTAEECRGKYYNPPAVLLSHAFWERRFASDPSVVGSKLTFNNSPAIVVGVLPTSFDFAAQFVPGKPVDLFVPWPLMDKSKPAGNTMVIIGRLKPGASVQTARAEFALLANHLNGQHPERNPIDPTLLPLQQRINRRVRPALLVLACAVGVVMLIVCANLSNLQLARLGARQRELGMRVALGASRFRLLRQMFTESIALSCCGAVLGLGLAVAGVRTVAHLTAFNLPLLTSGRVDGTVLAFTLLAAVLTGVLFGLLPALQAPAINVQEALKEGGGRALSAGRRRAWMRNGLVISEIAFASMLLVGAGLFVRSFISVLDVDLGFRPEHTAVLRVDPSFLVATLPQQNAFIDDMLQRARSVPGVRAAGLIDILPFAGDRSWQVSARGHIYPKNRHPEAFIRVVSDGYFAAAGIQLKAGRVFTQQDRATSERVVIVSVSDCHTRPQTRNPSRERWEQGGACMSWRRQTDYRVNPERPMDIASPGPPSSAPLRACRLPRDRRS